MRGDEFGGRSIVDIQASEIFDYAKPYFKGRSSTLSKVAGFLTVTSLKGIVDVTALASGNPGLVDLEGLYPYIIEEFVSTRKKKDGAEREIKEVLDVLRDISVPGPFVISINGEGVRLEQYLCLRAWEAAAERPPLVFVIADDELELGNIKSEIVRTSPLKKSELFDFLRQECGSKANDIERKFRTWIASRSPLYGRTSSQDPFIDLYEASSFLQFLENLPDEDEHSLPNPVLPRVPAPIMFQEEPLGIGLDHTLAVGVRPSHTAGAARALRNQAADLASLPTLENAIPRASVVLSRIAAVLERIAMSHGEAEEADLVEFGVEFSSLEGRVYEAGDRLGVLSRGEVLSFIGEATRFLNRFDIWKNYREQGGGEISKVADPAVASTAISILRSAISEGILTDEAAGRVASALENISESDGAVRREGLTRSTENLGAALGRGALKATKAGAVALGSELKERAVEVTADASERFVRKHAGQFLALAAARSGAWLTMMVSHLIDQ
jgi:hypothetical protein